MIRMDNILIVLSVSFLSLVSGSFPTNQSPVSLELWSWSQMEKSQPDYMNQTCSSNYHCNVSSWCCSEYKCVPGFICQNGQKEINDVCDYQFECFSRCCNKNTKKCSPVIDCVQECKANKDCTTGCCSFGYCSATNTCALGRKADEDYCDSGTECKNEKCLKNKCHIQEQLS